MGSGGFFQKKAAATPEEKLRSFNEKYERSGRMKRFFLRKFNPLFYRLHQGKRAIVPVPKKEEVSGEELCTAITSVMGSLSDRWGFQDEKEIRSCRFELNMVQFEKLLSGAREIVGSQSFASSNTPYSVWLETGGSDRQEVVVFFEALLQNGTKERAFELSEFAALAGFRLETRKNEHGENLIAVVPALRNGHGPV